MIEVVLIVVTVVFASATIMLWAVYGVVVLIRFVWKISPLPEKDKEDAFRCHGIPEALAPTMKRVITQ